jgi:preprotein translocase subunit SecF
MINIIQNRKISYTISGILILISILSIFIWGLQPGIDFTGGSLMEVRFEADRPTATTITDSLMNLDIGEVKVQPAGETNAIIRFKNIDEDKHQEVLKAISDIVAPVVDVDVTTDAVVDVTVDTTVATDLPAQLVIEERFETIGPVIGEEIKKKAWVAIFFTVIAIVLYIAYVFRKVSKPVASWKYGIAAIVALVHDIVIITGLFSILGHFFGTEVNSLFITALLTILGFSVNDTIVVFDRTRENLNKHYSQDFEKIVNDSVNSSITRSVNTSLTTLLILLALFFFGGETIKDFVLALIAGVVVGTYSSIFVASPIIVSWNKMKKMF